MKRYVIAIGRTGRVFGSYDSLDEAEADLAEASKCWPAMHVWIEDREWSNR